MLPVRTERPSGLKATASTAAAWWSGGPIGSPVAASQSRAVLSWLAERMVRPSGLKITERMNPPWGKALPAARVISQARAERSKPPVRIVLPSGLNATEETTF